MLHVYVCMYVCMYVPGEEFGDGIGGEDGRLISIRNASDERLKIFICG